MSLAEGTGSEDVGTGTVRKTEQLVTVLQKPYSACQEAVCSYMGPFVQVLP